MRENTYNICKLSNENIQKNSPLCHGGTSTIDFILPLRAGLTIWINFIQKL